MVKFKIAFTINAKTLFSYLQQALPALENLHVEEVIELPQTMEEKFLSGAPVKVVNKQMKQIKQMTKFKHPSEKTVEEFIVEYMKKTPENMTTWKELGNYIGTLGFKKTSINNGISRALKANLIDRVEVGRYKLHK